MRADAPCLQIFMLGPSWVEWQGRPLDICRKQARALLYRLAAHMQPVPREELCYVFWPDEPEAVAHRHLSHLISHLRASLPMQCVLRTYNELVDLDPRGAWSDSAVFWSNCRNPAFEQLQPIQLALELYRGPYLSGFSLPACSEFSLWLSEQRSLLERLYLDSLAYVMGVEAERAEYGKAILYARRYLKVDDVAEDVYRRLMMFHVMAGDRASALQQYQRCEETLKRRLGVDPLPETRAVHEAIMTRDAIIQKH